MTKLRGAYKRLAVCPDCGRERMIEYRDGKPRSLRCGTCSKIRNRSPNWLGGSTHNGYRFLALKPEDYFFRPMCDNRNRVLEHRLVMAKHLGRCLQYWEVVHHKNKIRDDNRIENLQLVTDDRHTQITLLETKIKRIEARVILLEADNVRLETELRELKRFETVVKQVL